METLFIKGKTRIKELVDSTVRIVEANKLERLMKALEYWRTEKAVRFERSFDAGGFPSGGTDSERELLDAYEAFDLED